MGEDNARIHVFVYGTLKPGFRFWPEFCEGRVARPPIPAKIEGRLYDLGVGYPGLTRAEPGWVHGYILSFPSEADLARVDGLEGYDPAGPPEENEYARLRVPCYEPEGAPLGEVWAYEMERGKIAAFGGVLIEDGVWKE